MRIFPDRNLEHFALAVFFTVMSACSGESPPEGSSNTSATPRLAPTTAANQPGNDFPTLERVEYVLQCMQEHGGQNYDNLYHCVCAVDTIAGMMSHEDFAQARTYTYLFDLPGERGGEFRDPPESERLRAKLKEAKAVAQRSCFPDDAGTKKSQGRKS
jgi:hypothetical protein